VDLGAVLRGRAGRRAGLGDEWTLKATPTELVGITLNLVQRFPSNRLRPIVCVSSLVSIGGIGFV
jgi:hypothetical protein